MDQYEMDFSDEEYTYEYVDEEEEVEDIDTDVDIDVSFTLKAPPAVVDLPTLDTPKNDVGAALCVPQDALNQEAHDLDEKIWICDPKTAYRLCKVVERRNDKLVVSFQDDVGQNVQKTVELCETQLRSLSHYCEDMCNLTELNEASVLHTIRSRYDLKLIHTYSGLFCVVVNPWCNVPLYTPEIIDYYTNESKVDKNLPPHIYAIAQSAYNGILQGALFSKQHPTRETNSQSILITGESGAGKTENTKRMIEYLLCCATNSTKSLSTVESIGTLDSAIINAGVALEAFSNAKTVHNNNSSRLGKFIRLDFDSHAKLNSARIDCYLLEKSRVVSQNEGDRNFHIFYQIFTDGFCNERRKRALGLFKNPDGYRFLNQGDCIYVNGIDDRDCAANTNRAMDELNFREIEKNWILECIAACILTGEIRFCERQGLDISYVGNPKDVDCVANLLGVNASHLIDALTQPTIRIGDNVIRKNQNLKKTLLLTSAFVKVLYERLFAWIVDKCNEAIESRNTGLISEAVPDNFIGVLDMAGFEIMNQNSFEQFCINYTNEKLQQFFNQVLFVKERNDYVSEGIEWEESNYGNDLQATIDLIERVNLSLNSLFNTYIGMKKPMGFLSLLQEECIVPNGKDSILLEKLFQNLAKSSGGRFTKAKYSSRSKSVNHFTILHYAGNVSYNIDGWVEKNRDLVDQGIIEVLSKSTHKLIGQLFTAVPKTLDVMTRSRKGSFATSTISCIYKEQLSNLLYTLNSSKAHFVRCIVPNYERRPFALDGALVMKQLKCNGVLEGIRVYRRGYPNRIPFGEFLRRYNILYPTQIVGNASTAMFGECLAIENMCKNLRLDATRYRVGKTKIFCRTGLISELENRRKDRLNDLVVRLQAYVRWYLEQENYQRKLREIDAITLIQSMVCRHVAFADWPWYRLWMKVRQLIPIAKDRRRLAELEVQNAELLKENKRLEMSVDELGEKLSANEERLTKLSVERECATQKAMELRQELKRNEELLELMERKFEDQHTKVMRLNTSLNDNMKLLERMDDEKRVLDNLHQALTKRHTEEVAVREAAQSALKEVREESARMQARVDSMFNELKSMDEKVQLRDEELNEWKEKFDRQTIEMAELNQIVIDANEKANKSENLLHEERNERRKYESEIDDLEEEIERLRCELDKGNVKQEAMKEQLRVKENSIRKLENKLDDKCVEMESCIAELKKMHKSSHMDMHTQLDDLKRKCLKFEMENKQQKLIIESNSNNMTSSSIFDRESSIDSDYGRSSTLGRYHSSSRHHIFGGSTTSIHASGYGISSSSSIRTLSSANRRRDIDPESLCGSRYYDMTTSSYGSLGRSLSNSSSRLSRNGTLSNLTVSITNTIDSGLARSSSSSSNAPSTNLQLQSSERKVAQLERDLHNTRTDGHLMKREVEVYKDSLQEAEKEKERLDKHIQSLNADIEQLNKSLKVEEDHSQQLTFEVRKATNECDVLKKRIEDNLQDSRNELAAERKKYFEKLEEQKHSYELKFNHLANSQKNFEKLQGELAEAQNQLDKALGQITQMERLHKSQDVIGVTWEAQYRGAVQEIESLRDENAALKSKIRRQYKQIELLTQQSEMNEYVNDLELKVDRFSNQVEKSASIVEIPLEKDGERRVLSRIRRDFT